MVRGEVRQGQFRLFDPVGHDTRLAARTAQHTQPLAIDGAMHVQKLERLEQFRNTGHPGKPEAAQKSPRACLGSGNRCRVTQCRRAAALRASGLHNDHGDLPLARLRCQRLEPRHRIESLDMKSQHAHPFVVKQAERQRRDSDIGLISGGHNVGDRQRPLLHRQAYGDVRRLRHDGDTRFVRSERTAAVLIRPERHAVEKIDQSVAVRPDDRHFGRVRDERGLECGAVIGFPESGCVADGAAASESGEVADYGKGGVAVHGDEGGVRRSGEIGDGPKRPSSFHLPVLGVNRPDLAVETQTITLPDHVACGGAADGGDSARAQQRGQPSAVSGSGGIGSAGHGTAHAQAPRGRSSSRPIMCL